MADTHFVIAIRNKVPVLVSGPPCIVTDNSDYTLELVPDEQWEGMETKTVIYAYDNGTAVHNPINGNQDKIPIIQTSGNLHIGVTAGDIQTSTWVSVPIRASIRRKAGVGIKPPAPDVYDKIMDMLGKQTGIKSVEILEGHETGEDGVGELLVYYLVITEKNGKKFMEKLPNLIEEIKNAAPGLVFDTVADMEAYIAGNAGTLKVGQDLFIREADVPDYWWDGTAAVPVETELGEVKKELGELSKAKVDKDQGAKNAGKLLYIGADGIVVPLTLGNGLKIENGVLMLTNATVTEAICGRAVCGEIICGGV